MLPIKVDFTASNIKKFTSINAFNIARHVLNNPTSQIFINGLKKHKKQHKSISLSVLTDWPYYHLVFDPPETNRK